MRSNLNPGPSLVRPLSGARRGVAVLAFSIVFLIANGFVAGQAAAEGWTYDLAGELMSPFCPGRTLSSCPSPQASELVQWISVQEAAGVTKDEVVEILVAEWGEEILGAPPAEGINLWAYILPYVGIFGGGLIAVLVIRQLVGGSKAAGGASSIESAAVPASGSGLPASPPSGAVPDDDELARIIQQDLASRG